MATQRTTLLGVMLFVATCGPALSAHFQNELPPEVEDLMYGSRSIPRQDATKDTYDLSPQCGAEIKRLLNGNLKTLENDAIMALDAFGKPPAGILQANWAWLGHYDECMAIEGFNYCLVDMMLNMTHVSGNKNESASVSAQLPGGLGDLKQITIRWGICPPANCTEKDIHAVLKELLDALKILEGIVPVDALSEVGAVCTKEPPIPYNAGFICTVILCGVIASLMIIGALLDEYLKLRAKRSTGQTLSGRNLISQPWRLLDDTDEADEDADDVPLLRDVGTASSINNDRSSPKKQSFVVRFLLCFALNRNLAKLMDVKQGDASISALNGIRVISMFWVILGHTIVFAVTANITDNSPTILNWLNTHWGFQAVANAFFSVDSFFFLSGFLLAYLILGRFRELRTVKRWCLFYFHRYWRLTPLFAFTILIWMYLPQFFGEGPIWQKNTARPYCPSNWWSSLLYIGNFWPVSFATQCIGWTWYLANDMQFFIISPLLLVPLFYYPLFGWLALFATLIASFVSTGLIIGLYDLDLNFVDTFLGKGNGNDYFSLVYEKPYCRIAPYLVGIGLGYIMHRIGKRKVRMSPVLAVIGWLAAAAMAMSVLYGLYPSLQTPMPMAAKVVYGSVSRFVWALALAWVVYACKYGYGGWINSFLSWSAWVPLGRITYSAYMIHPIVVLVFYDNFATTWHFSVYLVGFYFASMVSVSYFIAVFVALAIEYPFANLEKLLLPTSPTAKRVEDSNRVATTNAVVTVIRPSAENGVIPRNSAYERGVADAREGAAP